MSESPQTTPTEESLLCMRLPIPAVGEATTIRKGLLELHLENHRGGLCLLTPQPQQPQRHFLGVPRKGSLELIVRAPDHRVRVHLLDRLTLAPGGRLRGYVSVPLPHRLMYCRPNGKTEPLLDVVPKELQTSWLGEGADGGYVHDTDSTFHLDRRDVAADTIALVPVVISNHSHHAISPEYLTVSIRERDIRELDGQIVTSPRRLHFGEEEKVDERIRALPRRSA